MWVSIAGVLGASTLAADEPPGPLADTVRLTAAGEIVWDAEADALRYDVYKGIASAGAEWAWTHVCLALDVTATTVADPARPARERLFFYLVSKEHDGGEGPLGETSLGEPRPAPLPCVDVDGDGIADPIDSCPDAPNPIQEDYDLDGAGDPCDEDDDDDGLIDEQELVAGTDPFDPDSDDDGLGDGLEVLVLGSDPRSPDSDADGVGDRVDNCIVRTNPAQIDADADGDGDDCDNCPAAPNPEQDNADADGLGDACERRLARATDDGGGGPAAGLGHELARCVTGQTAAGRADGTSFILHIGFVPEAVPASGGLGAAGAKESLP